MFAINTSTGINDFNEQYDVNFFPNPTTNDLVISLEGIEFIDIIIVDINGKVLMQQSDLIKDLLIFLIIFQVYTSLKLFPKRVVG